MGSSTDPQALILVLLIVFCAFIQCWSSLGDIDALLLVNATQGDTRKMPKNLFGVSFETVHSEQLPNNHFSFCTISYRASIPSRPLYHPALYHPATTKQPLSCFPSHEINHAGAGGLWGELVSNRGFESGGRHYPSIIDPWSIVGDYSLVRVSTDLSSCFKRNPVALRMEVVCDSDGVNACPLGGVGIYNPGYWGMNIERGKSYKLVMYIRSLNSINMTVSLTESTGVQTLATTTIIASDVSNWKKIEVALEAKATNHNSRLQLKTNRKGVIWFDQVSLMPMDTYMGHGYRNDLFKMLADLKPGYIRFPGGSFVEGIFLRNAYRWKETVGSWEERPGHFGDVWSYWTDDGLGHFEFLQLAEDLGASPVWVLNSGLSREEAVDPTNITPFVQDALDGIEFARGDPNSTWGSVRADMGHAEPFNLKHIAIGNQGCGRANYRANYLKFYAAIKKVYPDIKVISNCDGSNTQLDHQAELYDYHVYENANTMFSLAHKFDHTSRIGPKAFVSEYAVTGKDAGSGSLLAALAEAGFLIGVEKNSDVVDMASNAPLFVNANDKRWMPDAIVFDSYRTYGTPSYWMQRLFSMSNGATLLISTLQSNSSSSLMASAIWFQNRMDNNNYLRVKVVNYGSNKLNLKIAIKGLDPDLIDYSRSSKTLLSSTNVMDENSFQNPTKVSPVQTSLKKSRNDISVILSPKSFSCFDLLILPDFGAQIHSISDMSYVSLI